MEWAPVGPQLASPVGPHVGYCLDVWAKLSMGFGAVYLVLSGPKWALIQRAQLHGPILDMVFIRGLNWTWVSDCSPGMEWTPIGPQLASPIIGPHIG